MILTHHNSMIIMMACLVLWAKAPKPTKLMSLDTPAAAAAACAAAWSPAHAAGLLLPDCCLKAIIHETAGSATAVVVDAGS